MVEAGFVSVQMVVDLYVYAVSNAEYEMAEVLQSAFSTLVVVSMNS